MTTRHLLTLLKTRIINDLRLNRIIDKNHRTKRSLLMLAVFISLYVVIVGQLAFYTYQLQRIGLESWLPYFTFLLTHIVLVFFNAFMVYGEFMAFNDINLLRSLPMNVKGLILSRFIYLYVLEAFAVFIISPATLLSWGILSEHYLLALSWWIGLSIFAPLITIGISLIISMAAVKLSQGFQRSQTAYNWINLLVILGISLIPLFKLLKYTDVALSALFSPATWLYLARLSYLPIPMSQLQSALVWTGASILVIGLALSILYSQFDILTTPLSNTQTGPAKVRKRQRSPIWALVVKEFKRFFSLPTYFMNTSFIMLSLPIGLITLSLLPEYIRQVALSLLNDYTAYIAIIIAGMAAMTNTTTVSLSLEGKHINWLVSLPVTFAIIYRSKVYFNLILFIPPTLLSSVLTIYAMDLVGLDRLFVLLIPLMMVIFSSWLGMLLNNYFQNYLWENETQVVKQSMAVLVNMLIILAVCAFSCWLINLWGYRASWMIIISLSIATILIRHHLTQRPIHPI